MAFRRSRQMVRLCTRKIHAVFSGDEINRSVMCGNAGPPKAAADLQPVDGA